MGAKTLQQLIDEACSIERRTPDIALNLDVCDAVKSKISHARLALDHLCKYINSKDMLQSYLAASLLDLLVINCGYPVHMLVAKKDFLNKLVYRFPGQPNEFLDKCHYMILCLLKKWSIALCERSRYKEDFSNINLMLALIKSRGYLIPEVEPAAVEVICRLTAELRAKEELDAEEQIVLESKLEDLLHRGQPADLVAANALMKKIVGYGNSIGEEYSASEGQIDDELTMLAEKMELLEELKEKGEIGTDAYSQLFSECQSVTPRLFALANSELSESVMMKLLAVNQRLHEVVDGLQSPGKTGDLHMDLLLDLDQAAKDLECKKKKNIEVDQVFDLYQANTPIKKPIAVTSSLYVGSQTVIVDVLNVDCGRFLRVFNADEKTLDGVEVERIAFGRIEGVQTGTKKMENFNLPIGIDVHYQRNGQQIKERLSLSII